MKNKYPFVATLIVIALITGLSLKKNNYSKNSFNEEVGEVETIGNEDDPDARLNFEIMRLADPLTGKIPAGIRAQELKFAQTLPKALPAFYNGRVQSDNWDYRGPGNVGGRTRALSIDVTNESIILAGSVSGGLYKSINGGTSWTKVTEPTYNPSVTCIAQDIRPGKTNIWYYGTGEGSGASQGGNGSYYYGNGIYKSTDGGNSWDTLSSTVSVNNNFDNNFDIIWNIATNPEAHDSIDEVYVAAIGGIYRSINGGANWTLVKGVPVSSGTYSYYTDVAITSTGVVYVTLSSDGPSTHNGIWRSPDGITWTKINPSLASNIKRNVIAISPFDENQVYFLAETPGAGLRVTTFLGDNVYHSLWKYKYLSGNGRSSGGRWQTRSLNLPSSGTPMDQFYSQGSYDLVIKIKPNDTNAVFIGGTNLYRSNDGFSSNTQTTQIGGYGIGSGYPTYTLYPNHHPDQHAIVFSKTDPNIMFNGNDGGVWKTMNAMSSNVGWISLNNGYSTVQFYTVAVDPDTANHNVIIGGAQDNGTWFTNSENVAIDWTHPNGGDGSFCAIEKGGANYYFSIQNGKMQKANVDNNGNKTAFRRIDPIGAKGYLFINPFVLDPTNNNIMYMAGGKHLWRNNDLSQIPLTNAIDSITTNWIKLTDSVSATISALAVSQNPANIVYYGTSDGKLYKLENANSTSQIRTEITSIGGSSPFPTGYINCITVDPLDGNKLFAVFSNYNIKSVYCSYDGGTSWKCIEGNLKGNAGPSCRWLALMPYPNDTTYFLGTSIGLFSTKLLKGDSTVWMKESPDIIGNTVIDMVITRLDDGMVTVATHGRGMFSKKLPFPTPAPNVINEKESFKLELFPNPSSGLSNLSFMLKKEKKVMIELFDKQGKQLKIINNSILPAGNHIITIQKENLPSGLYFCRLKAGSEQKIIKLVLVN